jgi:plasmid stabilization system protein ParE
MNVFRVNPTDQALTDAGEAYFWLNQHSPTAALRWYEGLLKAFRSLERNLLCCPLAPEHVFFDKDIRQLLHGKHRILFTVEGDTVFILRVRHGAQTPLVPDDDTDI